MNTRVSSVIGFILTALLFAGCSKEPQPSKSDIEQSLNAQLPAFARVSSFSVEAMQNMGTKVEPVWQSRFHATVTVTSDTFTPDGNDPGVVFVRVVKKDGESTELFGKSASTLYEGSWRTSLEFDGQPIPALGMPESAFAPNKVIVRGSKAETDYLAEQAEMKRAAAQREVERIKAESQMEAERLRAVAEAQKLKEQILADQRREAEQQGELRLQAWITPGSSFNGKLYDGQNDIRIVFVSVDTEKKVLNGKAYWDKSTSGGIPATYTFEGRWVGGTISATGTEATPAYDAGFAPAENRQCNLNLTAEASGRLEGTLCGDKIWFTKDYPENNADKSGKRGRLGFINNDIDETLVAKYNLTKRSGVVVVAVVPGLPAAKAGIEPGDIILKFNDREVATAKELHDLHLDPQTQVTLELLRKDKIITVIAETVDSGQ